jgi:cell division septum initiation protein DivIVA
VVDAIEKLQKENHCLKDENEELLQQLNDEKQRTAELEMKLIEMSRLTTGMARKASEDNLLKALRTYVNRSKRKTADKRSFAKSAILEIANANGLDLPEDLKDAIESLDDAEAETAVSVNAQKGSIVQVTSEGINNNNLLRAE